MAWSWNSSLSTGATGAAVGSSFGPAGTVAGGLIGGLIGGLTGGENEKKQGEYTAKVEGLLGPSNYTRFLGTPEGAEINSTLQNEINRQYNTTLREGKITGTRNVEAREMLSSNVLPRELNVLRKEQGNIRAGQQNALQNTLADAEVTRRADYENKELQKKILLSNMWAKAGEGATAAQTNMMNTLVGVGKSFGIANLLKKYGTNGEYYTGSYDNYGG